MLSGGGPGSCHLWTNLGRAARSRSIRTRAAPSRQKQRRGSNRGVSIEVALLLLDVAVGKTGAVRRGEDDAGMAPNFIECCREV